MIYDPKLYEIKKRVVSECLLSISDGPIVIRCIEEAFELGVAQGDPVEEKFVLPPNPEPVVFVLSKNSPPDSAGSAPEPSLPRGGALAISAFGEIKSTEEWLKDPRCKATRPAMYYRMKKGYDPEWSIVTPARKRVPEEHVISIYTSPASISDSDLAQKYGIAEKKVKRIRNRVSYLSITKNL